MKVLNYGKAALIGMASALVFACSASKPAITADSAPATKAEQATDDRFLWENANIYFLLTDRFNNADPTNDQSFNRKHDGAVLRSFEGGDIKGITEKINSGYFSKLGVNAIWLTPHVEQIRGYTDEGTGKTYPFHGYWAADWTAIDPNFGTPADMREFVDTAHENGIRVILDVVVNHTGPVTPQDPVWPDEWVRTSPQCDYKNRQNTVKCTLVKNLPDIKTESDTPVELPPRLVAKWKKEGRYNQEMQELDEFFARTGLPRAPRYYIMKWQVDYIREFGVDGFRIDTAKHTEADIWRDLEKLASDAYDEWKQNNPDKAIGDEDFYLTGEVYNYHIGNGTEFMMGPNDPENFFDDGFDSLINFSLRSDKDRSLEETFSEYSEILNNGVLANHSVVNYMSSHDDGSPYDRERKKPFETATKLFLTPGAVQIYYGDEIARPLSVEGAEGDAHLRSVMDWEAFDNNIERAGYKIQDIYAHWGKLGRFRAKHPAVGAGVHKKIADAPYTFARSLDEEKYGFADSVVVAVNEKGNTPITEVSVSAIFDDGTRVMDHYSGESYRVQGGKVKLKAPADLVLLGKL